MSTPKPIVLLGATGSIGHSTLRVLREHPDKLRLVGIAGNSRTRELAAIAREFSVREVAIYDEAACRKAIEDNLFPEGTRLHCGLEGLTELACLPEAHTVVTAIVGTLALRPTLAALEQGKHIALASKEILVMAGRYVMEVARRKGASILPLDSEHNAIFQCLQGERPVDVDRLILTASGGPFRDYTTDRMKTITREDALRHPNWDMGPKITVDSSTMANKGLEVIEARWLFDLPPERIDVVVHPQSIVHSMVQFVDGSIIAQLCPPSMTFAIQHSLLYPERARGVEATLDFSQAMNLEFRPPRWDDFPCLRLAFDALKADGAAPAIFNASNEIAVASFLDGKLPYLAIPETIAHTMGRLDGIQADSLDAIFAADQQARDYAREYIQTRS